MALQGTPHHLGQQLFHSFTLKFVKELINYKLKFNFYVYEFHNIVHWATVVQKSLNIYKISVYFALIRKNSRMNF